MSSGDDNIVAFRSRHNQHMDDLAVRVASHFEDEEIEDVMMACACIIGASLQQMTPKSRKIVRRIVFNFIDMITKREI